MRRCRRNKTSTLLLEKSPCIKLICTSYCRIHVLTHDEWNNFGKVLYGVIDEKWSLENRKETGLDFDYDKVSLETLRVVVEKQGPWGWMVWDKHEIPTLKYGNNQLLPTEKRHNLGRRHSVNDAVYQKWRSRHNNYNLMNCPEGKQKKKIDREKTYTGRRVLSIYQNEEGLSVGDFGTLVGSNSVPNQSIADHQELTKRMQDARPPTAELAKELVRLWETQYSVVNGIDQTVLLTKYDESKLVTVSTFLYYEAYAQKVCQLPKHSTDRLADVLYEIASVLPEICRGVKDSFYMVREEIYEEMPLLATLSAISYFFKESREFIVGISGSARSRMEIYEEVNRAGYCNAITNFDCHNPHNKTRFGAAVQGVPFIKDLTEAQAVFVFATAPDVFGFRPDQARHGKSKRINSLVEFLRRSCLGIADENKVPGLESARGIWE